MAQDRVRFQRTNGVGAAERFFLQTVGAVFGWVGRLGFEQVPLSPRALEKHVNDKVDAALVRLAQEFVDELRNLSDLAAVERKLESAARLLGFRHYAMIDHDDHRQLGPGRIFMQNYPGGYSEQYVAGRFHRIDPVVHACHIAAWSFCWAEIGKFLHLTSGHRAFLERGAREGVSDGITVPFHVFGERGGSCNFSGPLDPDKVRSLLWIVQSIGIFAYQAARRIARAGNGRALEPREVRSVKLTPRERECVILAGQGKTNKQIARDIGLYPSTVKFYLQRVNERYDVESRTQAAFFAALDGEIGVHEVLPPRFAFLGK
jgi:DNA-binding CsgD family transcriptional regulator